MDNIDKPVRAGSLYLNDPDRLAILARTGMLDSGAEPSFDRLTRLAARFLGTPVSLVSLVDDHRQFFKSCVGLPEPWASDHQTPLTHSFCQHVVTTREPLVIDDARIDSRVKDNQAIADLGVIAYLGIPLTIDGHVIGSFCAIDGQPRAWSEDDATMLGELAESVVTEIRLRGESQEKERQRSVAEDARRKIQVTLSSIGDAVIATDAHGRVSFLNPIAEQLTGWSNADANGQELEVVFRIVNEHTRQAVENPVAKVFKHGTIVGMAKRSILIAKEGSERPIDDSAAPIRDDTGEIDGVILVFRDVTERKEAEAREQAAAAEAIAANAKFHAIFDQGTWFIGILDLDGTLINVNQAALALCGYDRSEVGKAFWETNWWRGLPQSQEALRLSARHALEGRKTSAELRYVVADGMERIVDAVMAPIVDDGGTPLYLVISGFDVTDKRLAEEKAVRYSAQVQQLADLSTRLNATHDHQSLLGIVTNEARQLFGVHQSVAGLSGNKTGFSATSHTSFADKYAAWADHGESFEEDGLAANVLRSKRSLRLVHTDLEQRPEWRQWHAENPTRPPLRGWLAAPLMARSGDALGIIHLSDKNEGEFTADDEAILVQLAAITAVAIENARLYEELREADLRKDEFLAMLAHELRNPLAAISGGVTLIKTSKNSEKIEPIKEMIDRQTKHLTRLIDDLLDVSRIATGKVDLKKETVELGHVIARAIDLVRPIVMEKRHELTISRPDGEILFEADLTRTEQILGNLLTNAAKYTPTGGRIHLDASQAGHEIQFKITDSGVGIPPEMLSRVFGLFTQIDSSIDRSEGGLGIGLTLVRNLTEMHGGYVSATSEGPGKGSEFTVRLPIGQPDATECPLDSPEAIPPRSEVGRILVVDDNRDTARMTARLLANRGYEVQSAYDGHEAIEAARHFLPDFILLDIGLPGMNGYDVASLLRTDECCRDTVIIAVSGYGEDKARDRSRESGFHYHLTKPVDFDQLREILTRSPSEDT